LGGLLALYDVVHVNSTYNRGGAGIIAKNLHCSLLQNGLRSLYIFGYNGTFHSNYDESSVGLSNAYAIKLNSYFYRLTTSVLFGRTSHLKVVDYARSSDITHLHNIHGFFVDETKLLDSIPYETKIVWTMHDEWLLTGRCAVTYGCDGYMKRCQYCPHTDFYPASLKRNYEERFLKKLEFLQNHGRLNIVVQSNYLKQKLMSSPLSEYVIDKIVVIPNGIDKFDYSESATVLEKYGLQPGYVLFVSDYLTYSKGFDRLVEISSALPDTRFVAVGKSTKADVSIPNNIRILGRIPNVDVRSLYYYADSFLFLSRHDNYPTTILEAQDTCCPIIAVNTGAVAEMLEDYPNSFVMKEYDPTIIQSFVRKFNGYHERSKTSMLKYEDTTEGMAKAYLDLYQMISNHE